MTRDLIVYRSTHPHVLSAWHGVRKRSEEISQKRRALLDSWGFEGRPSLVTDQRILGVEHLPEHGPIPEGWKLDRVTENAIVPDRRRRVGREIHRQLSELNMPDPRTALTGGMPSMAWDIETNAHYWPGVRLMAGALYVRWRCDPEAIEQRDQINPEVWERVPLSEFYRIVEAETAKEAFNRG
ncbi:hypothetical protein [Planobispora longispora]|uniref:Uncharacterized protein n=1 Tax=Planobispora longispora TaxID=28887 RepID=A0A8J3RL52_9ACTN|nr:hypothetical protein [Planobispora longispora]BFE85805.1 hypothetical protein GCM10020093_084060 [Planobispora longispora]GIH76161.1 hypothetical protein Plo01_25900 [Planobispora longispora]